MFLLQFSAVGCGLIRLVVDLLECIWCFCVFACFFPFKGLLYLFNSVFVYGEMCGLSLILQSLYKHMILTENGKAKALMHLFFGPEQCGISSVFES